MYRFGQILALLLILPKRKRIKQATLYQWLLGYDDAAVSSDGPISTYIKQGKREVPGDLKDKIISAEVKDYSNYLAKEFDYVFDSTNRYAFVCKTALVLKSSDPLGLEAILGCINKKYEDINRERERFPFFDYLASLVKYSLAKIPNDVNNGLEKDDPSWVGDFEIASDFFDLERADHCPITIPFTVENDRFDRIFQLVQHEEVEVAGKASSLNIYVMPFENRRFDIQGLKQLLIRCAGSYALSRAKTREMIESDDSQLIAHEAILHLKNRYQDSINWDKALLNFFLFLFMECGLRAPKVFTSGELKTSDDFIEGCGGIYLLNNEFGTQLVFGVSAVDKSPSEAMRQIIDCSKSIAERFSEIPRMVDASLLSRMFSTNEALTIADLLIPQQKDGIFTQTEKSFGVFVGYEADLANKEEIISKGGYEKYIDGKLQQRMDALKRPFPKWS